MGDCVFACLGGTVPIVPQFLQNTSFFQQDGHILRMRMSKCHRDSSASAVAFDAVRLTALSYSREERGVRLANMSQSDFFAYHTGCGEARCLASLAAKAISFVIQRNNRNPL